ncbi:DUF5134 domain-containing protein [Streptomyces sp. H27-S2]|uniref:DUF5134 domain-containing protein n=1 Tax=Streptomyces antarcticus TaxID=2996458 RepID=UPI00226F405B|nr:DUF5134 domain-containing protein [Streptomyces sp. H27-S2]MCY0949353.1 DUF5134 domain-containing protein [Streptomyces sp. H27-S2]
MSPAVSSWLLVLLCAASGAYCLVRAGRAARPARGAAAGEAVMGLGMALMAVPVGTGAWGPPLLLAVFCAAAAHALWLLRGGAHHAHHLVGSLAMAYMALAMTAGGPGPGHGGGHGDGTGLPLVTGALLLYFAGYVLLGGARLVAGGDGAGGDGGVAGGAGRGGAAWAATAPPRSAELVRACRLAMGIGMLAMLLSM